MKRILALLPAIILCLTAAAKGTPAITFAETSHDFGIVKESAEWIQHSFKFVNSGTAPLTIITVSASCGCTQPVFDPHPIAPGDSSEITIKFTPQNSLGEFSKRATVRTNAKGRDSRVILKISGVITQ